MTPGFKIPSDCINRKVHHGDDMAFFRQHCHVTRPTREENNQMIRTYQTKPTTQARNHIVERNLPLVMAVAKITSRSTRRPLGDLINAGTLGLMRAIDLFDCDRGTSFTTYATYWIRQKIWMFVEQDRLVHHPTYVSEHIWKAYKLANQKNCTVADLTDEELTEGLRLKAKGVRCVRRAFRTLDVVNFGEGTSGESCSDLVVDSTADTLLQAKQEETKATLHEIIDQSIGDPRERDLILRRYGLNGYRPHTLKDIGKRWRITRERVRQIELKVLDKLRAKLLARESGL